MQKKVFLIGSPNSGKSTLFNELTGLNTKVANYPGVTVQSRHAQAKINLSDITVVDLPGTYSIIPTSQEEEICIRSVLRGKNNNPEFDLLLLVVDGTDLKAGLYFLKQLHEIGLNPIVAITMTDQRPCLKEKRVIKSFNKYFRTKAIPVSPKDKESINELKNVIVNELNKSQVQSIKPLEQAIITSELSKDLVQKLIAYIPDDFVRPNKKYVEQNLALYCYLLATRGFISHNIPTNIADDEREKIFKVISNLPKKRHEEIDKALKNINLDDCDIRYKSDRADNFLLQPILGSLFLLFIFSAFLQGLFLIAEPIADVLTDTIFYVAKTICSVIPSSWMLHSLLLDGVFEGVGSVFSFLPLIALLFLFLGILEDSGYLSRATFLLDSLLRRMGLSGRSLVPMLGGFACAVPAIMATRNINNKKQRLITIMVMPFLTCSARLPVYGLIVGALFSSYAPLFGIINVGALMFLLMYVLGITASLLAALVFSKLMPEREVSCLSLELPPFRLPRLKPILSRVLERVRVFIRDVGSIILAATIIIWALFSINISSIQSDFKKEKIQNNSIEHSVAGVLGKKLEPVFSPMGLDWQVSVGILTSFIAREVFVSTMGVLYGMDEANYQSPGLKASFKKNISPLSGICLLIFFALSMQCVSTLIATYRETKSYFWPILQFTMMTVLSYSLSLATYAIGSGLGYV